MISCEAIEKFTLNDFKKLKNVKKAMVRKENEFGVKDTFECDKEMVDYLTGNNPLNKAVVKIIEVMPEKIKMPIVENTGKEYVVPLDEEAMNIVAEEITKHIEVNEKPNKKKKSSKK